MVNLPENGKLKEQIFGGLRPILEEWSGVSRSGTWYTHTRARP